ncbi:NUDIX hydrolase domain-like protein [Lipomyces oligophaga]|uniref:NUDIX hydrolase domain-like protein n=1 Tax=Lipomyces oligophaga TaxID=45792 RepID=UPI0034CF4AA4
MALSNLDVIALVDSFEYPAGISVSATYANAPDNSVPREQFYKLLSHDKVAVLGYILPEVVKVLILERNCFIVEETSKTISIRPEYDSVEKRSEMMNNLASKWREEKTFKVLKGWRAELYGIYYPSKTLYFTMERSACSLFGFVTYGVHIIGYIPATGNKSMRIWVPRRSKTKSTYPGMLDNTVAGGIGYPYGVFDTLIKECGEEAGFPADLIENGAKACGSVSYHYLRTKEAGGESGLSQPEVQYCFDLKLDESSPEPTPVDGEAEEFNLWDVEKVRQEIAAGNFKPNTALGSLVAIDFLIRHGIITAENEPDYLEIVSRMHRIIEHPCR